jgi:hypothetical protein
MRSSTFYVDTHSQWCGGDAARGGEGVAAIGELKGRALT